MIEADDIIECELCNEKVLEPYFYGYSISQDVYIEECNCRRRVIHNICNRCMYAKVFPFIDMIKK